jgi:hypothetical protein
VNTVNSNHDPFFIVLGSYSTSFKRTRRGGYKAKDALQIHIRSNPAIEQGTNCQHFQAAGKLVLPSLLEVDRPRNSTHSDRSCQGSGAAS